MAKFSQKAKDKKDLCSDLICRINKEMFLKLDQRECLGLIEF